MGDTGNPRVYLDFEVEDRRGEDKDGSSSTSRRYVGRMVFELFIDTTPKLVENFRAMCTGERGETAYKEGWTIPLHYKYARMTHLTVGRCISGGCLDISDTSPSKAMQKESDMGEKRKDVGDLCDVSVYGGPFRIRPTCRSHVQSGLLTAESLQDGRDESTNKECQDLLVGSKFSITLGKCTEKDASSCIFGKLKVGYGVLRELEQLHTMPHSHKIIDRVFISDCGELDPDENGLRMDEDGDAYAMWPQDHPNMGNNRFHNRVTAAEELKDLGNNHFKQGSYKKAEVKYMKALRYLEKKFTNKAELYSQEQSERKLMTEKMIPILLNSAAVQLKLKKHRECIEACNKVQELERSLHLQGGKVNPKALYRRGLALSACREFESALEDLHICQQLEPRDKEVASAIKLVEKRWCAHQERSRNAYSRIFPS